MNMSSLFVLFVTLLSLFCATQGDTIWGSCDGIGISFKLFSLFPNPVAVGQSVSGNAVISLKDQVNPGDIKSGVISVQIQYNQGYTFTLTNIPLCNSTNAIVCSTLATGDNTISFGFEVPKIPAGNYSIKITAIVNGAQALTSCLIFELTVVDPTQNSMFHSFVEAHLAGAAQFENSDYNSRSIGDIVQVGPVGAVPPVYSYNFQWGTFLSVKGTEDVITPYFDPSNYVWGLNGSMVTMRYYNTTRQQIYQGDFTVGYVSDLSKRTMDVILFDGTFNLTWSYTMDAASGKVSSTLAGTLTLSDVTSLPLGWSFPVTFGRFGELQAATNDQGVLIVSGSTDYCETPSGCTPASSVVGGSNPAKKSATPLNSRNLGLIIGLCVGIPLVVILIVAIILWRRHRQRTDEEDGIFSAARKPEYGNALVVDDIIQETREHGGNNLIPRLDRHPGDTYSNYSESEDELSRRGRRRERSLSPESRSASPDSEEGHSGSPPKYRSRDEDEDDYSDYSRSDAASDAYSTDEDR